MEIKSKSGYVFTRNPIIISNNFSESADGINDGIKFDITMGNDTTAIYNGMSSLPLNVNVAEILDANSEFFAEVPDGNTDYICKIEDDRRIDQRIATIREYTDNGYEDDASVIVIPGGISKQNYKALDAMGTDIFLQRFHNPACNFFMTTRTIGWRIAMKETELMPLYFLSEKEQFITLVELTQNIRYGAYIQRGVYAFDVSVLRRELYDDEGVISNMFDVYRDGKYACRIVIERSDATKERYRLKFRNSLGVFEVIEITGQMAITPEFDPDGDAVFNRYDSVTDDYYSARERVSRPQSISIVTGSKRSDEVRFLMDMLSSEEVYLLNMISIPVRVIPSVDEMQYLATPDGPAIFTLKLDIADTETNIMQEIIDGTEGKKPRVFSKQFNDKFN
jgi:hypothetical protein